MKNNTLKLILGLAFNKFGSVSNFLGKCSQLYITKTQYNIQDQIVLLYPVFLTLFSSPNNVPLLSLLFILVMAPSIAFLFHLADLCGRTGIFTNANNKF